jgi:hypothetical protein
MEVRPSLTNSGFCGLKSRKLSIRIHEVVKSETPKKEGSSVVGSALMTCHNFGISAYQWIGIRDFCPESPEVVSSEVARESQLSI